MSRRNVAKVDPSDWAAKRKVILLSSAVSYVICYIDLMLFLINLPSGSNRNGETEARRESNDG
jgi:hypothetical protein